MGEYLGHDKCCPAVQSPQGPCACAAIDCAREDERQSIEGILARTFSQADPGKIDRDTWQRALRAVERRAYMRGLNEGRADD